MRLPRFISALRLSLLFLLAACGQLASPTTTDLAPAATAGGTVVAWGLNGDGQTNVPALPEGMSYTDVAGGGFHNLAVRSDGQVVAWGDNRFGAINVPALPEGMSYTDVAGGNDHSLALRSDGQVVAWGYTRDGATNVPALPAGVSYTAVADGSFHSLALRSDGQVVAWGSYTYGQTNVPTPPESMSYTAVAGGTYHTLALRSDGQVVARGDNQYGQVSVPALPAGMSYTAVAAGGNHSLAVRSDGQVVAWGDNDYGLTNVPALPAGVNYTAVAGGIYHSLAVRSDGKVVAWGYNAQGQANVPTLPEGSGYLSVAAGNYHSLAIIVPKQAQTLSFTSTAPTNATVGGTYTVSAEATSGLSVTFGTTTPNICTLSGSTVSFVAAGTCTVTADQAGNTSFEAAPQVTQDITVSVTPPPFTPATYTVDLTTAPLNRILWDVRVGRGVTYEGDGTANTSIIRVDGQRYLSGKLSGGNQLKVLNLYGSRRLALVRVGTNIPFPNGGVIDIKPHVGFNGIPGGTNGFLTLKSITVSNITAPGAQLTLWGGGSFIKRIPLAQTGAGRSVTIPLNEPGVSFVQVSARSAFAVDDVVFEDAGSLR